MGLVVCNELIELHSLTAGTAIYAVHRVYRHYGIYIGQARVIHYVGGVFCSSARIEETDFTEFCGRCPVRASAIPRSPTHAAEILARARSRLGEHGYSLLRNNCEHFASWCHTGVALSTQVDELVEALPSLSGLARCLARGVGVEGLRGSD
jgi:hypothetical protein